MRFPAALVLTAAALALSSCGGSGSGNTGASAADQPQTSTSKPKVHTSTAVVTSTVTSTTAAVPPLCTAADFAARFLGQQGATGHGELGFVLLNRSGHTCHTFGYPGVLFLGRSGHPLPTRSSRTTHDFFGRVPKVRLTVAPGAVVSFRLGVTHGVVPKIPCRNAYALQVIPPDDTHAVRARIKGGAFECETATVSPLRPGTSAYP